MPASPSSTSVGKGSSTGARTAGPRAGAGSAVRQRRTGGTSSTATRPKAPAASAGMWHFYNEDSPGITVSPVAVLIMSLLFIASVFLLHIWGKYTRS